MKTEKVAVAEVAKKFTVALIKPDVVANEEVDEIAEKIESAGMEILINDEKMLNEEEATEFYQNKSEEEYFSDLITYVTSGPCRVLILTKGESGEGVLELWRDIIGPFDAAAAKSEFPESLRSIYGENIIRNALHASVSYADAERELRLFYPDYQLPTYTEKTVTVRKIDLPPQIEKTLGIIRPDAYKMFKDDIMKKVGASGLKLLCQKEKFFNETEAKRFYIHHRDQYYFPTLIKEASSGPFYVFCLGGDDAVQTWKNMIGPDTVEEAIEDAPKSLCALFQVEGNQFNSLHGSQTVKDARKELEKFFDKKEIIMNKEPEKPPEESQSSKDEEEDASAPEETLRDSKKGRRSKRKSAKKRKIRQRSSERRVGSGKKKRKGSGKKRGSAKKKKSGRISGSETSSETGSYSDRSESAGTLASAEEDDRNDASPVLEGIQENPETENKEELNEIDKEKLAQDESNKADVKERENEDEETDKKADVEEKVNVVDEEGKEIGKEEKLLNETYQDDFDVSDESKVEKEHLGTSDEDGIINDEIEAAHDTTVDKPSETVLETSKAELNESDAPANKDEHAIPETYSSDFFDDEKQASNDEEASPGIKESETLQETRNESAEKMKNEETTADETQEQSEDEEEKANESPEVTEMTAEAEANANTNTTEEEKATESPEVTEMTAEAGTNGTTNTTEEKKATESPEVTEMTAEAGTNGTTNTTEEEKATESPEATEMTAEAGTNGTTNTTEEEKATESPETTGIIPEANSEDQSKTEIETAVESVSEIN